MAEHIMVTGSAVKPVLETLGAKDTPETLQGVALEASVRLIKAMVTEVDPETFGRVRDRALVRCTFEVYYEEES